MMGTMLMRLERPAENIISMDSIFGMVPISSALLMDKLPAEHKARWFAGAALNSAEQAMASVLSTTMSRLNAFLDMDSIFGMVPISSANTMTRPGSFPPPGKEPEPVPAIDG